MDTIVILDTNVLLADPNSVLSFPRAEVVVPETVLSELDKLKTARVDPDLRFRGREVSRILFDLSEEGSLVDGVELPDGGMLRVAPDGVSPRNADDRILITANQVLKGAKEGTDVRLVTNDLNMLLKAQTLGIPVTRYGNGVEAGFAKQYIIRPFQRYRVPITILAVALAVFVGVVFIAMYTQSSRTGGNTALSAEFKGLLSADQIQAFDSLNTLQTNPDDPEALLKMANIYFDSHANAINTDAAAAQSFGQQGIRYYERYLRISPQDNDARSDLATLYFDTAQIDRAIKVVQQVLADDPNHVKANYNLGLFYARGRRDYPASEAQFKKVIELTQADSNQHAVYQQATLLLQQIKEIQNPSKNSSSTPTSGAAQ
jgi:hypothetical protein